MPGDAMRDEEAVKSFYEECMRPLAPNQGGVPTSDGLYDGLPWGELSGDEQDEVAWIKRHCDGVCLFAPDGDGGVK